MKVKRGERSNTFCGPAALSLLTGKHVDTCIREIRAYHNFDRSPVKSMDKHEITRVLNQMGYTINSAFHSEVAGLRVPFGSSWSQNEGHWETHTRRTHALAQKTGWV